MYLQFAASAEGARFFAAQQAELRYHADPHDKTRSTDYAQKRPPKHEFVREARTLTNRPKRR